MDGRDKQDNKAPLPRPDGTCAVRVPAVRQRGHQVQPIQQQQHRAVAVLLQGLQAPLDGGRDAAGTLTQEGARQERRLGGGLQPRGGRGRGRGAQLNCLAVRGAAGDNRGQDVRGWRDLFPQIS